MYLITPQSRVQSVFIQENLLYTLLIQNTKPPKPRLPIPTIEDLIGKDEVPELPDYKCLEYFKERFSKH